MSLIFSISHKKGHSRAIDQIFSRNKGIQAILSVITFVQRSYF